MKRFGKILGWVFIAEACRIEPTDHEVETCITRCPMCAWESYPSQEAE
jgi:hypothetical protein